MIEINDQLSLADGEVELSAIRASGPGGQHVNKVASAIQLRFDIAGSSLPDDIKQKLLRQLKGRLGSDGQLVLKAQNFRSQERNRRDAIARLVALIQTAARPVKPRRPTRPGLAAKARRVDEKKRKGEVKATRRKPEME